MNDTEAMREQGDQIREALSCLKALQVDEDTYLRLEDIYETTANILYPEGLTTEDQYERLVVISKAGCVAIGYSDEQVELVPPDVSFQQRGTYLMKMPAIADKVIEEEMAEMTGRNDEWTQKPYIIIRREKLARRISIFHLKESFHNLSDLRKQHLVSRADSVAEKLGWSRHVCDEVWQQKDVAYALPIKPDIEACRKARSDWVRDNGNSSIIEIDTVLRVGRRAAFGKHVDDPEELISHLAWRDLFDELGYIYDPEKSEIKPKPIDMPDNAQDLLMAKISALRTYVCRHYQNFLIEDDLYEAVRSVIGEGLTNRGIRKLVNNGIVGRVLIKLGYQRTTHWADKRDLVTGGCQKYNYGTNIFIPAMRIDPEPKTPEFASGFRIHSPTLVRDNGTVVYLELLGPRQAVKANWAALRQRHNSHYFYRGWVQIDKEDKVTTLKATLPCGWDHWCLIHRQASYDKLTPQEPFYLIVDNITPSGMPSSFMAFLAKSLPIPILPEWAEHLWLEGRMKDLITPLAEKSYGYGAWKVEAGGGVWNTIISEGLNEKLISF